MGVEGRGYTILFFVVFSFAFISSSGWIGHFGEGGGDITNIGILSAVRSCSCSCISTLVRFHQIVF